MDHEERDIVLQSGTRSKMSKQFRIVNHSDKAFSLYGNIMDYIKDLVLLGGVYNPGCGEPFFSFSNSKRSAVEKFILSSSADDSSSRPAESSRSVESSCKYCSRAHTSEQHEKIDPEGVNEFLLLSKKLARQYIMKMREIEDKSFE